jgi:hypothetical protein
LNPFRGSIALLSARPQCRVLPQVRARPPAPSGLRRGVRIVIAAAAVILLSACGDFIPGQWEHNCKRSMLVMDSDRCHVALDREGTPLAFIPEGDGWLFAAAWTSEDYPLIQATFDIPGLRRAVRAEGGYCAGPICWIEFTDAEVSKVARRGSFRVELTRVLHSEDGRMRRGTTGFHVPTRGLSDALQRLRTESSP